MAGKLRLHLATLFGGSGSTNVVQHDSDGNPIAWRDDDGTLWAKCRHCDRRIFPQTVWSHEGGTPPQDHRAETF